MEEDKILITCSTLTKENEYVAITSTDNKIKTTPYMHLAMEFESQDAAERYLNRLEEHGPDVQAYRHFKIQRTRIATLKTVEPKRNPKIVIRGRAGDMDTYVAKGEDYETEPRLTTNMSDAKCFFTDTDACQFFDKYKNALGTLECPEVVTITESKGWRLD